jgi:hypothetical protein
MQHALPSSPTRGLDFEKVYETNDYATQRGLEFELDVQHNSPPLNYNRPIDPNNANLLKYLKAANDFFDAQEGTP